MNEIQLFTNEAFGSIRVVKQDGEPWFVAKDICLALGLDPVSGVRGLDEDEKGLHTVQTPGGNQQMSVVSEAGMYGLIIRSRKAEAKAFRRWVMHEVLPSIRKHGFYGTDDFIEYTLQNPDWAISMFMQVKHERENRMLAEMQRDEAVRTKAWIGERREATAMATASAAVRQRDKALDDLGEGKNWKQVKGIKWLREIFDLTPGAYSLIGRKLSKLSDDMGIPPREVESSEYGTVKRYHASVIERFHAMLIADPAMMGRYRLGNAA